MSAVWFRVSCCVQHTQSRHSRYLCESSGQRRTQQCHWSGADQLWLIVIQE